MQGSHNVQLTALSIALAVAASYTALELARRVTLARSGTRLVWLVGGACVMGIGIWAMHFTAMLAYRLPVPIHYEVPLWLLSIAIAVSLSLFALAIVSREQVGPVATVFAGFAMGGAIAGMHYTGMAAVWVPGRLTHDPLFVIASVTIAIVAALAALRLLIHFRSAVGPGAWLGKAASACVMGSAIAGMHYTAMAGVRFWPAMAPVPTPDVTLLSAAGLAPAVISGAFAILLLALLAAFAEHRLAEARAETELLRERASMLEALQLLAAIVEWSDDAIISQQPDGTILSWNPAAERMFGYSAAEMIGNNAARLVPADRAGEDAEMLARVTAGEHTHHVETVRVCKDGRTLQVSLTISPIHGDDGGTSSVAVTVRDMTERKQLEERLRQAQRMEAVGRFAGGIAHDFNNLLMVVHGNLEMIPAPVREHAELRGELDEIARATERATRLTQQLLAFSRKQVLQTEMIDLNVMLLELDSMIRRLIGKDIEVVTLPAEEPAYTLADRRQMEQVVMNLVVNARDAMSSGGVLTIRLNNIQLSDEKARRHSFTLPGGNYVRLIVADTGEGMSGETQAQAFEPFFTTKERGKGTGLGLSTVYGIVRQSGGYLGVHSEQGAGSRFEIYLPRAEGPGARMETAGIPRESHGGRSLLVVEDEPAVRSLVQRVLQKAGYEVTTAGNGEEALRIWSMGSFDLVVTDVVMPIMGGFEMVSRLREHEPELPIVYMSGYVEEVALHSRQLPARTHFLQKPFSPSVLVSAIGAALENAHGTSGI